MEPLSALINRKLLLPSQKTNYIAVETHFLSHALREQVGRIFVDEDWYAGKYPDVLLALGEGKIKTVAEHFVLYGYYEHRMPHAIKVDEKWYLSEYEDIAKAVQGRLFASGQSHFDEIGYKEGRIPYPYFKLKLRSDLA